MELVVDLATASVVIRQRDDAKRFSVLALPHQPGDDAGNGALGALAAALSLHDVGTVDPGGDVFVPADVVRRMAAHAATEEGEILFDRQSDLQETGVVLAHAIGAPILSTTASVESNAVRRVGGDEHHGGEKTHTRVTGL